jgi:hypothetical protein
MTWDKKKARLILIKIGLREYPIIGKMERYDREGILSFLLDVVQHDHDWTVAQQGMWRQIEADFDKWVREDKARKEGRL